MRRITLCFLAALGGAVWLGRAALAQTWIVVDTGGYASAVVAAGAEAAVNWNDDNLADDEICTHCFAAVELQHYLRKATGRSDDFAIVDDDSSPQGDLILIGGPKTNALLRQFAGSLQIDQRQLESLGPEGYRIRSAASAGRRITVIAGGGRVGTLYGVYDLLHRLGCRWFAPGELHEEVPRVQCIADLDVAEKPAFATRGFFAWEDRGNPEFLIWMARSRLNDWCVEQSNHPLLKKLGIRLAGGVHDAEERFINPASPYPYDHPRFSGDEQKPKDPYPLSDLYQGDANADGKLSYFEAHPEWYALVAGRRVPGIQGFFGVNYCTSNPYATAEFVKNFVQATIDGPYRNADIIRLWTLDVGRWCQCPNCQAQGIPTDRNLLLVYRLDQEIKKARSAGKIKRPILIRFLAYADVLQPPTRPLPADFDYTTCWATYYPIARCYVHTLDDPRCATNARYAKQLHGWAVDPNRFFRGPLQIGEYYNVSVYKCLPVNFSRTMAHDIPYYYRIGARQFEYMHVTTGHWGTKALTNYQLARQLWNPQTDCSALWDDYFAKRYGPAAGIMRRFYDSLDPMLANVSEIKYGLARRLNQGSSDLFPNSHLRLERQGGLECDGPTWLEILQHSRNCRAEINRALEMDLPPRIRARIAEDERAFTYAERTISYYDACVRAFQAVRSGRKEEARQHYGRAGELARLLAQDKVSASMSSSHASAADAFEATLATGALKHLARLLDSPDTKRDSGHKPGSPRR